VTDHKLFETVRSLTHRLSFSLCAKRDDGAAACSCSLHSMPPPAEHALSLAQARSSPAAPSPPANLLQPIPECPPQSALGGAERADRSQPALQSLGLHARDAQGWCPLLSAAAITLRAPAAAANHDPRMLRGPAKGKPCQLRRHQCTAHATTAALQTRRTVPAQPASHALASLKSVP